MNGAWAVIAAAAISGVIAAVGIYYSRRTEKEGTEIDAELGQFTILEGTVSTLSGEVKRLTGEVHEARTEAQWLNRELQAARTNVRILSAHIRQHLPEVPFPNLVAMNDRDN